MCIRDSCYRERYRVVYRERYRVVYRELAEIVSRDRAETEVVSWDRVTNGNRMSIRFRVRDREFSTVRVYRRGDYGFAG